MLSSNSTRAQTRAPIAERVRQAVRVADRAPENDTLFEQRFRPCQIAQKHGQVAGLVQGFRPKTDSISASSIIGLIQCLKQPVAAFAVMAVQMPEPAQRPGQAQTRR